MEWQFHILSKEILPLSVRSNISSWEPVLFDLSLQGLGVGNFSKVLSAEHEQMLIYIELDDQHALEEERDVADQYQNPRHSSRWLDR